MAAPLNPGINSYLFLVCAPFCERRRAGATCVQSADKAGSLGGGRLILWHLLCPPLIHCPARADKGSGQMFWATFWAANLNAKNRCWLFIPRIAFWFDWFLIYLPFSYEFFCLSFYCLGRCLGIVFKTVGWVRANQLANNWQFKELLGVGGGENRLNVLRKRQENN